MDSQRPKLALGRRDGGSACRKRGYDILLVADEPSGDDRHGGFGAQTGDDLGRERREHLDDIGNALLDVAPDVVQRNGIDEEEALDGEKALLARSLDDGGAGADNAVGRGGRADKAGGDIAVLQAVHKVCVNDDDFSGVFRLCHLFRNVADIAVEKEHHAAVGAERAGKPVIVLDGGNYRIFFKNL